MVRLVFELKDHNTPYTHNNNITYLFSPFFCLIQDTYIIHKKTHKKLYLCSDIAREKEKREGEEEREKEIERERDRQR